MPEPIPIKDHEKENRLVNKRLLACALLVIGITCALVGRMYFLQVVQYDYHSTISENNRVHVLPITPTRGLIYDRNGVVLADNRPSYNLTITRERASNVNEELDEVVSLLHLPAEDRTSFDKAMKQARHPFVPVT
ncbi:MAG: penicillin-binding protein 2, partial [Pseudomonas sp.]